MVRQRQSRPRNLDTDTPTPGDTPSLGERIWEATQKIGGDMPDGMEPKGGGWYGSPDEIDPRDCANYPDSIWCGGTPGDPRQGITLDLDWGVNECGAWGSVQGGIFGLPLPTHTRAWLKEECRQDYERKELDRKHPPPEPPPDWSTERRIQTPQYRPSGFRLNDRVCVVTADTYFEEFQEWKGEDHGWAVMTYFSTGSASSCDYPTSELVQRHGLPHDLITATASTRGTVSCHQTFNPAWVWHYRLSPDAQRSVGYPPPPQAASEEEEILLAIPYDLPNGNEFTTNWDYQKSWHAYTLRAGINGLALYIGKFGDIFPQYNLSNSGTGETKDQYGRTIERWLIMRERKVLFCKKLDGSLRPKRPHRDSPPPPEKECCMQCCSTTIQRSNDNDDLLRRILKKLENLEKRIGVNEYPVPLPETLNTDYNNQGNKTLPRVVKEENLTTLIGRFIRYFDGVMGEWGIGFKVEDADPEKEGDQPKFIHAPNMAELSAEMYQHIFDIWMMQYQLLQLHQRHAVETMLSRKVGIQNYFQLEALIDWSGFKRKELVKKIPFLFDIDAEKYADFLKNKEQEIQVTDFDFKEKGAESFPDHLLRLKRAAAIIEAVHTKRFNPNMDLAPQILEILQGVTSRTEKVNKDEYKGQNDGDFDQWLRDAENAFWNRHGTGDPFTPYGKELPERPRLTKLQDTLSGGEDAD